MKLSSRTKALDINGLLKAFYNTPELPLLSTASVMFKNHMNIMLQALFQILMATQFVSNPENNNSPCSILFCNE